jgi:hypothetical protein
VELNPRYLFAFHDLMLAYYRKARAMPEARKRLETLAAMLEAYMRTIELDGQIDAGTLPPAARDALDRFAAWGMAEADSAGGRATA